MTHHATKPHVSRFTHHASRFTLLAVLLLAFTLRVYRLDGQSFWSDEGISLLRSDQPLGALLANMPTEHVPGYFVILHGWLALVGANDFAVRFLSVWPSVLAVALLYRLGAEMGATAARPHRTRAAGLIGAALLATGAFQVWYAQEARMYSWLLAAALTATLCLWRILYGERPGRAAAGYALAMTLTVYLHLYGFLIALAHTLFVAGWALVHRDLRRVGLWLGAGVATFLLFLPWLPRAWGITAFEGWRAPGDPTTIPWRYVQAYTVGDTAPALLQTWPVLLYIALALLGVVVWWRVRPAAAWLLVTLFALPLVAVVALAVRNPDFHERYTIALTAPLILLVAGGVTGLLPGMWSARAGPVSWRHWLAPGLVTVLLLGVNGASLARLYTDTSLHKPDFRGAAWRIEHEESPDQVVLVDGPDPDKVFNHYYTGANRVYDLRFLATAGWDEVDAVLRDATAGKTDAWEVLYFHPPATVQTWLAVNGWATAPSDHNGIRVTRYGLPGPPMMTTDLGVAFGDALTLETAEVSAAPLAAGDVLRVSTHWFTHAPPPEYKFSLRLVDASGEPVLARDYVPQNGFAPTSVWIVDQPATDQRGVIIPPDLAPGTYTLTLRLYNPVDGAAVETARGQDVALGQVEVVAD